jgi:hypothetical protein
MSKSSHLLEPQLEDRFSALRFIPKRGHRSAKRGREKFLAQAQTLKLTVSNSSDQRHYGWIDSIQHLIRSKEYSPMYVTITSIILAITFLLGGTGLTVYAAQDSLPNEALYGAKLLSEDFMMSLTGGEEKAMQMELEFAERRVNEIAAMALIGENPPEPVLFRLKIHLDQALHLAARTREEKLGPVMYQVQEKLRRQLLILEQAPHAGPIMIQTREALQIRLHWAELGLNEPQSFRKQARNRVHFNQGPETGVKDPQGNGTKDSQEPSDCGFSPGPNSEQKSAEAGYGPGPLTETESKEAGYGPSPNNEQGPNEGGYGPGPNNEQEPTKEEYGPGPGSASPCTVNCDPTCTGNGSEPNNPQTQEGGSGNGNRSKP